MTVNQSLIITVLGGRMSRQPEIVFRLKEVAVLFLLMQKY